MRGRLLRPGQPIRGIPGTRRRSQQVRPERAQRSFTATVRRHLLAPAAPRCPAVVSGVLARVAVDGLFVERQDAGLARAWAFAVTAPASWPFQALPGPLLWVGVLVDAVFQAAVLGAAYGRFSGRLHHRTGPSGA
ncbi:SCO4225 family membrane protein [Streptomyces sp. NPDC101151]|uniref:SCO4225 family membrane protein n=1 Tax=Streptomyces sp. NPDC101151 TaxID=3366115 RepID=UPI00380E81FA